MAKPRVIEITIVALFVVFLLLLICAINPFNMLNNEIPGLDLLNGTFFITDKESPSNWIKENQIEVYSDRIVIRINDAILSRYANTKSMDPTLDGTANGIEIPVTNVDQIHVGDIIAFQPTENSEELIVHRVVKIGSDELGWYCITKGDNNNQTDGKIRFEQIKYITIAILY